MASSTGRRERGGRREVGSKQRRKGGSVNNEYPTNKIRGEGKKGVRTVEG
jgi:hypothetical protein